jgi:tetratricopeptide (TPR) repeat protein/cephalosporin hydroxylase
MSIKKTFELALKNHQENNIEVAQNLYNQVLEIDPKNINVHNNLGTIFNKLRDFQKARLCYEKVIEIDPNIAMPHYNLGIIFTQTEEYLKAKKCYEKAIEIDPNNTNAHNNLGLVNNILGEGQKAKSCFEKTIEIDSNYLEGHNNLGFIFLNLNEYQKAKSCFEKTIEINPNNINAHNNLGVIYNKLGELRKAISCYERVIEIDPNYEDVDYNLSIVFNKLGKHQDSYNSHIKYLQKKSKGIVSNAKLENVIPKFVKKLKHQNDIPTFFDSAVNFHLTKQKNPNIDFCEVFEKGQLSKENRFVSYSKRIKDISESKEVNALHHQLPFISSQGIHSLIEWKGKPLYKSAFDLVIYSMILQEIKPDIIIELGSGLGGSAIWLADTASMLGLDTHVYSFDINKPLIKHDKVTFIEEDLTKINQKNKPAYWELFKGKKIIIEDAHVNIKEVLSLFDTILRKNDYLIIEDSNTKQEIISHFLIEKEIKYKLDQFFLDFFGTNVTCCTNSIFKCH